MRFWVQPLASPSGLKILRCRGSGIGQWRQLQFDPSLETAIWRGCGPRKYKKTKNKKIKRKKCTPVAYHVCHLTFCITCDKPLSCHSAITQRMASIHVVRWDMKTRLLDFWDVQNQSFRTLSLDLKLNEGFRCALGCFALIQIPHYKWNH